MKRTFTLLFILICALLCTMGAIITANAADIEYIPGDCNADGIINGKDITAVRRYNAGYEVRLNIAAADCNGDAIINGKDITAVRRYNAGYSVVLVESPFTNTHFLLPTAAKDATCIETGNIEYYTCSLCEKIYSDKDAAAEITLSDTIINAKGHTAGDWIIDKEATEAETGNKHTECTACHIVLETAEIPKILPPEELPFSPRSGNSSYGYLQFAYETNGVAMQELYYELYTACEDFADSDDNITPSTINFADGPQTVYILDYAVYDSCLGQDEVSSVWKVFCYENPAYYWLANSFLLSSDYKIYLLLHEPYALAETRKACDQAIAGMADECAAVLTDGMSDVEKALAIHDFIILRMDYAFEEDGITPRNEIWAYNLTGCAVNKLGVCESYAKTYMYLCLLNNVENIIVVGNAQGGHAWNIIKINEEWYGVDCTWDEGYTLDNQSISTVWFGLSGAELSATHTPNPPVYGIEYQYPLPELAEVGLTLVTLALAS